MNSTPSDETIARLILDFTERRQERTRLRVFQSLSAAFALLLLTAVALGTVAHFARQRAARNEQRARVSKVAAEGIVDDMLRELGRKLEGIGKLELLENVTTAAENYFARMDPELRDAQTETHAALAAMTSGDILRQKGDHAAACEHYARAEAQLTRLAAVAPGNARLCRDLGHARNNLAIVALLADDHLAQAAWHARAEPAIAEAVRLEPANLNYRREGLLMRIRLLDENTPTAEWETLVAETKQLFRENPNSINVRLMSFASEAAAQAWEKQGDLEKAAALFTSATEIIFDVEELLPDDAGVQLDLADCLRALAQLERKRGRSEQSINAMEAAENVSRSLRQRDPLNQEWIGQYAQLLSVSADLHVAAGQIEGGLERAREATALLRSAQERHPATRQYTRDAALALATFGHQLARTNAWSDAITTWSGSADLLERLSAIGGLTADQEVSLAIVHRSLAEAALSPTPPDLAGARAFLAKALSRLRALQARRETSERRIKLHPRVGAAGTRSIRTISLRSNTFAI